MTLLAALQGHVATFQTAGRLCVGFSGGADSHALLHALVTLSRSVRLPAIEAIHINHGLQIEAGHWAEHCAQVAAELQVGFTLEAVQVDTQASPESQARVARYRAFEKHLGEGDLLLLAHHRDDQVETILFRLIRGAGPRGLAGMPETRALGVATLLRPLLAVTRQDIERYVLQHDLDVIDDTSNANIDIDRNFLRHEVLPLIESRWPGYRAGFTRSSAVLAQISKRPSLLHSSQVSSVGDPTFHLQNLDAAELHDQIYHWLHGLGLQVPPHTTIAEFARQCLEADPDKQPELRHRHFVMQRWRQSIQIYPLKPAGGFCVEAVVGHSLQGVWGSLDWVQVSFGLNAGEVVSLRAPKPGEALKLRGRPRRTLNQCLQENEVPPYWRGSIPVICQGDSVVAVAGLGITQEAFDKTVSCKEGLVPVWIAPKLCFVN
jgi:tRNA(Ile)-lysidine synthase